MTRRRAATLGSFLLALAMRPAAAQADEPPAIEHQPPLCTVAGQALQLCAGISDDGAVASARVYFRRAGEAYYAFVNMTFTGVGYCGTLPAPLPRTKAIEYYVQAVDNAYQPTRTSTFRLPVLAEGACEFPPLERDPARAAAIKVFATNQRQGRHLDDGFAPSGVTFVPAAR
ncbi:MAG TPA: hypothetical protein VMX54_14460 [Vicinamibacteria bacterium]|nr:hypothetical protein [Vicinamibacteria bacterium]